MDEERGLTIKIIKPWTVGTDDPGYSAICDLPSGSQIRVNAGTIPGALNKFSEALDKYIEGQAAIYLGLEEK